MAITAGRRTVVTIDAPRYYNAETGLAKQYDLNEIQPGGVKESDHVELVPNVGWRIATYQMRAEQKHEASVADDSVLNTENGSASVADGLLSIPIQRAYTELPGVVQGANQRSSGDLYLRKNVAADGSFDIQLTGDAAAYPPPPDGTGFQPVDRILVANQPMDPNHGVGVVIQTPNMPGSARLGIIDRIYFGSIASAIANRPDGTGQYCLIQRASGIAQLVEKDVDGNWQGRRFFQWAPSSKVMGATHAITIRSDARKINGKWRGSRILFNFSTVTGVTSLRNEVLGGVLNPEWQEYLVPQDREVEYQPVPVRLDVRRDVRALIQTSIEKPYPTGILNTLRVSLDAPAHGDEPLYVQWFGSNPAGCSVVITLFGDDGSPIASNGEVVDSDVAGGKAFILPEGTKGFTARFTLTSANPKTPSIRTVRFVRDHRIEVTTLTPTELPKVTRLSLTDGGSDPTHETASFQCEDLFGEVPQLAFRSGMPVNVDLYYDSENPETRVNLFKGKIVDSPARSPRGDEDPWRSYSLKAVGEWEKLSRKQLTARIDLLRDPAITPESGKDTPYKVTDLIKALFRELGYPPEMVDVPDYPVRFLGDDKLPMILEPFTEAAPFIMLLVRNYLGGWLVFDPSAGDDGKWRVKIPPQKIDGSYRYVCEFVLGPEVGDAKTGLNPGGYVPRVVGDFTVPRIPARKGPFFSRAIAPEANVIYVRGMGNIDPEGSTFAVGGRTALSPPPAYNFKSALFYQGQEVLPDPTSPDYTDGEVRPLYYSDPGLNSGAAVRLTQRRLYDLTAHGRIRHSIEAPLVLVQEEEDGVKRKPMYGDPCLFGAEDFYIVECNIQASGPSGGDRFQLASYIIESIPELADYRGITNRVN